MWLTAVSLCTSGRSTWTSCPCCAGWWRCACWGVCVRAAEVGRSAARRTPKTRPRTASLCPDSGAPGVMESRVNSRIRTQLPGSEVLTWTTDLPGGRLEVPDSSSVRQSAFYSHDEIPLLAAPKFSRETDTLEHYFWKWTTFKRVLNLLFFEATFLH